MSVQRPLEMILARNLLSSIATPAFLLGHDGSLAYFNQAAEVLVGRRFEATGRLSADEWTALFGPFDEQERPIAWKTSPVTGALRENRPYHGKFRICVSGGQHQDIAASAIPIVGSSGPSGAIVIFWPLNEGEGE